MSQERHSSRGGLIRVMGREFGRMASAPVYLFGMVILPITFAAVLIALFGPGTLRDLPVRVVDLDGSPSSGRLLRMIDASSGLRVDGTDRTVEAAHAGILRGESYGTIVIPEHFERDLTRGQSPHVSVFYNGIYLLPASTIRKEALAAVGTFSATVEAGARTGRGQPVNTARAQVDPVSVDTHVMSNPALNYTAYLVTGILITLLQIFVITMATHAYGSELRDGTAGGWLEAAGGSSVAAIVGKLLPYWVFFSVMGLALLAVLFGWLQVPLAGSLALIAGATPLFVLGYLAMGFAFVAVTGNLRMATSFGAFYSVPAFAFMGLTFPAFGMPVLGQAWNSLLPLTHYLRIVVDQALRGAPLALAERPLQILLAFGLVPFIATGWRMIALARNPKAWGRL